MAKNSFTFQAALKLNSAGFKKGVNEVKSALAGLKSSFLSLAGALGAGLGFTQLISHVKDTAVQLSVAQNVLKNVSKVTKEYTDGVNKGSIEISNYAENLEYVRNLSKTYAQDLISLTNNFAKFHAACDKTNLSLEQQKDVFEALTRAAAYYHMSADQTNDMTLAITQMMSKGKVSSEELRRQLGNSLPGAFNLMAAAIGVTTAQLEDMMKKGQVISAEALPRFAAMLNTVTKNADFDSLQMSINRLKNTWTDFVEKSGAENIFQGVVNGANSFLTIVTRNINEISSAIKGLVAGILSLKLFDYLKRRGEQYVADMEKALNRVRKDIAKLQQEGKVDFRFGFVNLKKGTVLTKEEVDTLIAYNKELAKRVRTEAALNYKPGRGKDFLFDKGDLQKIEAANAELLKMRATLDTMSGKSKSFISTLGAGIKSIGASLKAMIASLGWTALIAVIIGALTSIISYIKKIRDEWKRVNNIVNDYSKAVQQVDTETAKNATLLRNYLKTAQDVTKGERERLVALKEINKLMGTNYNVDALDKTKQAYKDIVKEVERWIEATKLQAKIQVQATKSAEAQAEIERLKLGITDKENELKKVAVVKGSDENGNPVYGAKSIIDSFKVSKLKKEIEIDRAAIVELTKVVGLADKALEELGVKLSEVVDVSANDLGGGGGGGGGKAQGIEKVFEDYTDELKELDNKLREHAITQEEYNREFDSLVMKLWEKAAATGKLSIEAILDKAEKGQALSKMEQWYKDLYNNAQRAALNATLAAATEAIDKAIEEELEKADKEIKDKMDKWAENYQKVLDADFAGITAKKPTRKKRDSTFDYNKTQGTILEESAGMSSDYVKDLEDAINTIVSKYDKLSDASEAVRKKLEEWRAEMGLAKKEAATLEQAMKFAKIQDDIDNLKKSINEAAFGGMRNLATSLDRIIKGGESLRSVFEESDSTGWEKFMAIFNELVQVIETIMSAYQTMQTIQKATAKLDEAEIALAATKVALLEKELLLRQAIAATRAEEVDKTEAQAAANLAEAATAKVSASAKAGEAVAGATASGSKLPFPYNLAAIAAGIAAVLAALSSMSKFANGGIVGGNSYSGDKVISRLNSGEMVLNKNQQANLWAMLNGKKSAGGGEVNFKIRGDYLYGVLKNYSDMRKG